MPGTGNPPLKVKVVGGFYSEVCRFPHFFEYYGSGGRGAAAMPKGDVDVELFTFVDTEHLPNLMAIAEASGFTAEPSAIESLYRFEYLHPLSAPVFYSPRQKPQDSLKVEGDVVLCYGMMEGQPLVKAKTAVFDPQSHLDAKLFSSNGSVAERLGIVANQAEAKLLTGDDDEETAATKLLVIENASVVVVKCGHRGAIVATKQGVSRVPAYRTERVFKIGSGDVFSSIFTYAWAVCGMEPFAAAEAASLATAYYCNCGSLPIHWPVPRTFSPPELHPSAQTKTAYLAGPFFNPAELWMIEECRNLLSRFGIAVFSPFHSVGFGPPKEIATADLDGLDDSDFVFAILDGFDAGTLFEIGYAIAKSKKPVIAVYHGRDECNLTMLVGTKCKIFNDIASAVYAAASI